MLARDLGKTVAELSAMPMTEYAGWLALYRLEEREREKAEKAAAQRAKQRR